MHGEVGVRLCGVRLDESSSSQSSLRKKKKSNSRFFYTPNILFSHSDPVTPGLFSGLGTVDVGKVPLGAWSCAITWHTLTRRRCIQSSPLMEGLALSGKLYHVFIWLLWPFESLASSAHAGFPSWPSSLWLPPLHVSFISIPGSRRAFCIWEDDVPGQLTPEDLRAGCPRRVLARASAAFSRKYELLLNFFLSLSLFFF